jgi:glycosyltransferase involved in cell wall biosynthesis
MSFETAPRRAMKKDLHVRMSQQRIRGYLVMPAYKEADGIVAFLREVSDFLHRTHASVGNDVDWNVLVVNDGSPDHTESMLAKAKSEIHFEHVSVDYINLLRNFGHQSALLAGLRTASTRGADFVITLDADGEHPIDLIPELVRHWRAGASIVHTSRIPDPRLSKFKGLSSRVYYVLLKKLGNLEISSGMADYKLWDGALLRNIRPHLNTCGSTRAFASWLSPEAPVVPYKQNVVEGRVSRFTIAKMVSLALSGLVRYSEFPIRLAFYVGVCALVIATLMFIQAIAAFLMGTAMPGWTSIVATIIFFGGVQCFLLGVYGEYFLRNLFRSNLPTFVIKSDPRRARNSQENDQEPTHKSHQG